MLLWCFLVPLLLNTLSIAAYGVLDSLQLQTELAAALNLPAAHLSKSHDPWDSSFKVEQQLLGTGFHRKVEYTVQYEALDAQELQDCQLLLLQYLPSSIYADPYQLEDMSRANSKSETANISTGVGNSSVTTSNTGSRSATAFGFQLLGPLDLEQPAPACEPTALLLHFNLTQQQPTTSATALLSVPLHAKYPEPVSFYYQGWQTLTTGYIGVVLPQPLLLVDCRSTGGQLQVLKAPQEPTEADVSAGSTYSATAESADHVGQWQQQQLVWSVPAGNLDHIHFVSWGTLLVTAACCVALSCKAVRVALGGV